jgi:hypothetical protein
MLHNEPSVINVRLAGDAHWLDGHGLMEDLSSEPTTPTASGESHLQRWGRAHWAAWVPEAVNAAIVALVVVAALKRVIWPYSDADIQASLVDTYEPSAWGVLIVCVVGLVGIGGAALVRSVAQSRARRRIAVLQIIFLLVCIALAGWQHHTLMKRTTELTGQTFEGFP